MFTPNSQQQQQTCHNRNCPPFGSSLSQSQRRLQNNPFNHLHAPQNSFHFETQQNQPGRQARSAIFGWGQSFNFQNNPFRNANNQQGGNRQNQPSLPQQNDLSQNLNEAMNNNNEGLRRNLSEGNLGNSEGQQNQANQQGQQTQQNAQNNIQQQGQLARQNSFGQQNQSNPQLSESQRFWSQWGQPDPNITNRLFNNATAQHIGLNPQSFQNGPPPLGLRRQGSVNMEQSNDLALEFERFNRFFNINPEVYSPRRNRPVQTDVKCKYCPKKANETSHMVCQDCVVQEQNQLRKFFQIKAQQMIQKDKESTEQIRKLKRQLANAQKDRNQLVINHERNLTELRSKLAEQTARNMELMEKVTKLKDIVKVEQNFREECKLLTEENNQGWTNIYQWAEKFNQFVKRVLVLLPKRGNQLSKHIIKSEQDMIFTIQHKLSQIPKEIISTIEQAQEEKTNELNCLKETQQQVVSLLQSQKAAFEKCDSAFPELTMNLAVEPFKNGISDLEKRINQLEEVKSECTLFSIFSVDRNESAKNSQKHEEPKKMNQSEADVLDANDPNSPVGDGKKEKESEE